MSFSFSDAGPSSWGGLYFLPLFPHDDAEIEALRAQKDEDCRLYGYFDVSKVTAETSLNIKGSTGNATSAVTFGCLKERFRRVTAAVGHSDTF